MTSLWTILAEAAAEIPQKPLFVFPETRWNSEEVLTYEGLATRAASVVSAIRPVAKDGDRALLMFPTGAAFWEAYFGCLASGVIAVPLKTPNLNRTNDQLAEICRDCTPSVLLTDEKTAELLVRRADLHPMLSQIPVATPAQWRSRGGEVQFLSRDDHAIAFLQYTSGSTARPKGVQISHGNLLANMASIRDRMQLRMYEDSAVTWLPHYHDMGLIGSYLTALFLRITSNCLPPDEFAIHPSRLLELISSTRATICGGPDFTYRLCVEKITDEQRQGLDLSSWRVAYVGAERIRAETLQKFTARFSPVGFRRSSFFPCYGLGESTLMVTGGPAGRDPAILQISTAGLMENQIRPPRSNEDCSNLVGSGQTFQPSNVLILGISTGQTLGDDMVGEVVVAGPSVTSGYFQRPELNDELFTEISVDGQRIRFLHTGDLGFLSSGELFITGRIKETMIVRGRNLSPEDIEQQMSDVHESLVPGGTIAFSAEKGGEECVIVAAELKRSAVRMDRPETVFAAIRTRVSENFGVSPGEIVLLGPASIPRTSSGKPKRLAMRDLYLNGQFEFVARSG